MRARREAEAAHSARSHVRPLAARAHPLHSRPPTARTIKLVTFNIHGWRDAEHTDNFDGSSEIAPTTQTRRALSKRNHASVCRTRRRRSILAGGTRSACPRLSTAGGQPARRGRESNLCRLADALDLPHWTFGAAVATEPEPQPFRKSFFGQYPFGNGILSRFELGDIRHTLLKVTPVDLSLGGQAHARRLGGPTNDNSGRPAAWWRLPWRMQHASGPQERIIARAPDWPRRRALCRRLQ